MNYPHKLPRLLSIIFTGIAVVLSVGPIAEAQRKSVRAGVNTKSKKRLVQNIDKKRGGSYNSYNVAPPTGYPVVADSFESIEGDKGLKEASKLPSGPVSYIHTSAKKKKSVSKKRR